MAQSYAKVVPQSRGGENELRRVIEALPGLIWTALPDGEIDFLNQGWSAYTGLSHIQSYGRGWQTAIHPEDLPGFLDRWRSILAASEPCELEARLRRVDGDYRRFLIRIRPLADSSGRIVKWCGISIDIENRTRREEALHARWWLWPPAREHHLRAIAQGLWSHGILITSAGAVEFLNRTATEYFSATLKERGWVLPELVHPEDVQNVVSVWRAAFEERRPYDVMARLRRADGVYRWFQARGFPLEDAEGRIVFWYLLHIDVDDRKRSEDALRARERNLNLIINTIPALAWSARPDGSAEFFNQHFLDYTALTPEQAADWGWTIVAHPDDRTRLLDTWHAIMASGMPGEGEARLRRFDGEYRWFLFRANPLRDEFGKIVKWYGINTDIEDRKRVEEALRASELNLRQLTETIPEMLWSATPEGTIDYCNARFLNYTGFSAQEVMGNGWQRAVYPEDAERVVPLWISSVATGQPYRVEVRIFYRADQSYRWCAVSALPLLDQQGRILRWHGTIVDMDDWKTAQEELRNTQSKLAHVARVTTMGQLTASIAHEVNQPLAGIITNAGTCLRMLAGDPPNIDGARKTAERMIRDSHRASDVIKRLRALFSNKDLATESVDLNEAAREVIALSLSDLQRRGVILKTDFTSDLPSVSGDRVQLQQVILNLILNAADAMGGVDDRPRQLMIGTEWHDAEQVRLYVSDAGVGFAPHDADKLFQAFYTTKSSGMGIGLSVSRAIIERHHGRLWAAPNEGVGATFSFSIPVRTITRA